MKFFLWRTAAGEFALRRGFFTRRSVSLLLRGSHRILNSPLSPGSTAPPAPPRLHQRKYFPHRIETPTRLTSSTREYEAHNRKHRLQISSLNYPHNRNDDDGDRDEYGDDGKFLSPESLLKFETDWLHSLAGFEVCEPVDPVMDGAYGVGVMDGVHEGVRVGVVFCGFGAGDAVGGVLGEEEMSAIAWAIEKWQGAAGSAYSKFVSISWLPAVTSPTHFCIVARTGSKIYQPLQKLAQKVLDMSRLRPEITVAFRGLFTSKNAGFALE